MDAASVVREQLNKLTEGALLFDAPEEMTVGESARVQLSLADQAAVIAAGQTITEALIEGLEISGTPTVEPIKIGTLMKARLSGDGFDIKLLSSSEEQPVGGSDATVWAWSVVPKRAGDHKLSLLVTVRIQVPGIADETKDYPVKDKRIRVRVNPGFTVSQFLGAYGLPIAGVFAVALLSAAIIVGARRSQARANRLGLSPSDASLLSKINKHFGEDDLKTLCFDLDVDYENLAGETKSSKARELILELERQGRLPELVERCKRARPNVLWT